MHLIGLTGGIASGKSVACHYIQRHSDIPIIDADEIAHDMFQKYNAQIAVMFPEVNKNGVVKREDLSRIVFNDLVKKKKLEHFLHPLIRRRILVKLFYYWITARPLVILDIPLLFEMKLDQLMDKVLLIYCSPTIQIRRLRHRNGFTLEQASSRLHSQMPLVEKICLSDVVIDNNGSLSELYDQLDVFIEDVKQSYSIVDSILFYITPMMFLFLIVLRIVIFISSIT
jgi:dephospho-CoA kinase